MIILGLETSCDDCGAAVYDGNALRSNVISTQLVHREFGGVVPELASRAHMRLIIPVVQQALSSAEICLDDVDAVAVTYGPGLAGSLLVGLSFAKGLSLSLQIPFIGINHLEGHIWANALEEDDLSPPFLVLIVSGGHTQIIHVESWGVYGVLGRTRDDAAGEAFDKVGKLLGLGYPGGPVVEKAAANGDPERIRFPRAYLDSGSLDFSFSGLKTAVLNYVRSLDGDPTENQRENIAAGFQEAVVDVLVDKVLMAADQTGVERIRLAGGVAVNGRLRERLHNRCEEKGLHVRWPAPDLCTDNAGMIARAGFYYLNLDVRSDLSLSPVPGLNLANRTG